VGRTFTVLHLFEEIFGTFHEEKRNKVEMALGEKSSSQSPPHCP